MFPGSAVGQGSSAVMAIAWITARKQVESLAPEFQHATSVAKKRKKELFSSGHPYVHLISFLLAGHSVLLLEIPEGKEQCSTGNVLKFSACSLSANAPILKTYNDQDKSHRADMRVITNNKRETLSLVKHQHFLPCS